MAEGIKKRPHADTGAMVWRWTKRYGAVAGVAVVAVVAVVASEFFGTTPDQGNAAGPAQDVTSPASSTSPSWEAVGKDLEAVTGVEASGQEVQQAALRLLASRSRAALSGQDDDWLASIDPRERDFRNQQRDVFANFAKVPFASWDYYGTSSSQVTAVKHHNSQQAYVVPVVFQYSFADRHGAALKRTAPVRRRVSVRVVRYEKKWWIAGFESATAVEPWDQGRVHVTRGQRSLLLSVGPTPHARQLVQELDAAGDHVDSLWGREWPRVSVAILPKSQRGLAQLLGRPANSGLHQIAAMTSGEIERPGTVAAGTSSDRVLLNPNGFPTLGSLGRSVVLRHELVHVATRSVAQQNVPMWMSEGYADYIAYFGLTIDERKVAASAIAKYASQKSPKLPTRHEFDASSGQVAPAYGGAWLAVMAISRHGGPEKTKAVYRHTAAVGQPQRKSEDPERAADRALATVVGLSRADLVRKWQQEMQRVAAANYSQQKATR